MKFLASTKAAQIVAAATTATGVGTSWIDLIPDDIGKVASLVGLVLTIVLIVGHIRKGGIERKKIALENKILELKIKEKLKAD